MNIANKLWGFCNTLHHEGIDYGDFIEQFTYLLFLKMADEKDIKLPQIKISDNETRDGDWDSLKTLSGNYLTDHYLLLLHTLREQQGLVGDIFAQAMPRFNNPVNLKRLINIIDEQEWKLLNMDVKEQIFEGLLEKVASEGKKGAGQYFTPRVLIQSIVKLIKPDPRASENYKIFDPACGTGGFLVSAYQWLIEETGGVWDRKHNKSIKTKTYYGQDLVPRLRRLAIMNLFLQGLEAKIYLGDAISERDRGEKYDCILTNPPFGSKSAKQVLTRDDFIVETNKKQLNFLQHVFTILKPGGRAALVLPDNCLYARKAGEVFEIIMQDCNVHTILRLPKGTFSPYSPGTRANVVFLQKGLPTENVWIFDARSNVAVVNKTKNPLTSQHFAEFEKCYGIDPNGKSQLKDLGIEGRFRNFPISDVQERNYNLDITWLKDKSMEWTEYLPEPDVLVSKAITELEAVIYDLEDILELIEVEE